MWMNVDYKKNLFGFGVDEIWPWNNILTSISLIRYNSGWNNYCPVKMIILGDNTYSNLAALVLKMSYFKFGLRTWSVKIFILLSWDGLFKTTCSRQDSRVPPWPLTPNIHEWGRGKPEQYQKKNNPIKKE